MVFQKGYRIKMYISYINYALWFSINLLPRNDNELLKEMNINRNDGY